MDLGSLSSHLEQLSIASEADANTHLTAAIELLEKDACDRAAATQAAVSADTLNHVIKLLASDSSREQAAQVVAELAKDDAIRQPCVEAGLIPPLLALLKTTSIPLVIQACRALGNICFDNDSGRNAVDDEDGVAQLVELLRTYLDRTEHDASKLRMVACGFLLNLTNTHGLSLSSCNVQQHCGVEKQTLSPQDEGENIRMITLRLSLNPNSTQESLQGKAVAVGAMEILDSYLQHHSDDENLCQMVLLCVGSLADSEPGKAHLSQCDIPVTIGHLLDTPAGAELQDTILELLANLAESDEVKLQMSKSDVKLRLVQLLRDSEKMGEEDGQALAKLSSDLIVLLLTGDESMEELYAKGEGPIFKESLVWLRSSNPQLQMSGALAIGNFARNDAQCCRLVEDGITDTLLDLLRTTGPDGSPTLQHAILSALRNLAIPAANKSRMLKCGLLDTVMPFTDVQMMAVQFKLLGLMRMIVDKQESAATFLGTHTDFVTHLIQQCGIEDHAGVKGEANRLVAWVIKNSQAAEVLRLLAQKGAAPFLVNMANAEHAVMQNEALVSLTLMATTVPDDSLSLMQEADIVPTVKVILTDDDSADEIICNVLTLVAQLSKSAELKELIKIAEIPAIVKKLQKHKDSRVQKQAKDVGSILGKG